MYRPQIFILVLLISAFMIACDEDPVAIDLQVPATYSFERNGQSSVSYDGQTERIEQLTQIRSVLNDANSGNQVSGQDLLDMYANKDGNGGGNFDFTSTKQLKDKTFLGDQAAFDQLLTDLGNASIIGANGDTAVDGSIGLLWRGNDPSRSILVDEKGHEFSQIFQKGMMGAVIYYQILSTYMSDARVGDNVDNTTIEDGSNYTTMEHHWDEAFGYLGVPVDFSSNWPSDRNGEAKFVGSYIRERDNILGSGDIIMNAFKKGRAAIVANEYDIKNQQRDIIYTELEKIFAASAIHYINAVLAASSDEGERFHTLSECYAFIKGLQYSPRATLSISEITQLLKDISDDNFNFWNASVIGLNNAKTTLSTAFGLDNVKDDL
ncbi:MAG: DUF4856 domain-containing protein [Bacteroidetes bacterium]|nr:DUF4856 domain-containing protein [Bacteroidota bacterium]